jgi:hypothetical protein
VDFIAAVGVAWSGVRCRSVTFIWHEEHRGMIPAVEPRRDNVKFYRSQNSKPLDPLLGQNQTCRC